MAERNEIIAVYVAGVIQGVVLVTFPAANTVLTAPTPPSSLCVDAGRLITA